MDSKKPVQEPDLEGVKMKMPEQDHESLPEVGGPQHRDYRMLIILLLTLVLVGILAGLYFWFMSLMAEREEPTIIDATRPTAEENDEPESTTAESRADSMDIMSRSTELSAIEADLESTNLEDLDADMNAIEAELNANPQ